MNKKTLVFVFASAILLTFLLYLYSNNQNRPATTQDNGQELSYEECAKLPESVIQESFPPVCVTQDGKRIVKRITQEEEQDLVENTDTSEWETFNDSVVDVALVYPPDWGEPQIDSSSRGDSVEFENGFSIEKRVYYTPQRDRLLTYEEFVQSNRPSGALVTSYEIDSYNTKRISYNYSASERGELFVFPPNEAGEILTISFHYPENNIEQIRRYFSVIASFELRPNITSPTPTDDNDCIITGCSGQICSNEEVVTTCEYREEYACYEGAECERQENGECGWTMTDELRSCLGE